MKGASLQSQLMDADMTEPNQWIAYIRENKITVVVYYNDNLVVQCYHSFDKHNIALKGEKQLQHACF